nr:hypothetical protein BaRGS_031599 [Batillaria attramentaria]
MSDNSVQIKKDLVEYMYNLRIPASVEVVEMEDKDISAYTIERTLMMEERNKLMAEMRLKRKDSVRIVDNIMDRAHPYSSTNLTKARAVSTATDAQIPVQPDQVKVVVDDDQPVAGPTKPKYNVHYTFSPEAATARKDVREAFNISDNANFGFSSATESDEDTPHKARKKTNMRKMHTAVRLNEMLREKSQNAELVVINMPSVPTNATSQTSYMEFLEVLSEGLVRVVMVKGTGREVITIYN